MPERLKAFLRALRNPTSKPPDIEDMDARLDDVADRLLKLQTRVATERQQYDDRLHDRGRARA